MFAETVFDARRIVYRKPSSDTFDLFSICVSFVSEFVVENSTNLAIIISIFAAGFVSGFILSKRKEFVHIIMIGIMFNLNYHFMRLLLLVLENRVILSIKRFLHACNNTAAAYNDSNDVQHAFEEYDLDNHKDNDKDIAIDNDNDNDNGGDNNNDKVVEKKEEIEQLERIFGYCDDHPLSHDDNNNDENYDDAEYFDNNDDRDNYCNERNPVHHDVGAIFNNNNNDTYNNNDDDVGNEDDNDDDENDEERKSCYQNDHPVRNDNIDANDVYDELTIDGDAFNLGTNREDNESNGHPVCNCFKAFFSWLLCLED